MKPIRKTRHALMFMGAGALGAYFLDPEAGPARRDRLMGQVRSLTGDLGTGGSSEQSGASDQPSDDEQSSGTASSGSGEVSASGSADAFADATSDSGDSADSGESSSPPAGSGPIDLATGQPVSDTPLGA
jgi:hypothetical protein